MQRPRQRVGLHIALFLMTGLSATWAQLPLPGDLPLWRALLAAIVDPPRLIHGLLFSATLMAILLAHEMGHYLTARRYGVDQSLPYFIPAPTLVGTLGAVIVMRSQPPNRAVLLKVAVMGPFAGLIVAVAACAWGLMHSTSAELADIDPRQPYLLGSSILFDLLRARFAPSDVGLALHPVAFAGWVGLFVTSLNLIPAAQLDGGHVAYAMFGRHQGRISGFVVIALLGIGLFYGLGGANPGWGGLVWILWGVILFIVGLRHPPTRDDQTPLTFGQRLGGWLALVLFVVTFVPIPLSVSDDVAGAPTNGALILPPADPFRSLRSLGSFDDAKSDGPKDQQPTSPAEEFSL